MGELINNLFDQISAFLFGSFNDGMYARGFFVGLVLAFIFGWLTRAFFFHIGRMQKFFKTIPPSLNPSPSGYSSMKSCSCSALILGAILVFIISIGFGFLYAWITP
jgi:hypothetical protein